MAKVIRTKGKVRLRVSEKEDPIYKQGWVIQTGMPLIKRPRGKTNTQSQDSKKNK